MARATIGGLERGVARTARGAVRDAERIVGVPAKAMGNVNNALRSVAPAAQSFANRTGKAMLQYTKKGVLITHCEYLKDIESAVTTYTSVTHAINPALKETFRWLSGVASSYEKYVFKKLSINYRPAVGTSTAGSVIISPDFDVLDAAPPTKKHAMSAVYTTRCAPWENVSCDIPAEKLNIEKYTRVRSAPTGSDRKTYDIANIHIATEGVPASTVLGEIYLQYTVLLMTPQFSDQTHGDLYKATAGLTKDALVGTDPKWYGVYSEEDFVWQGADGWKCLKGGFWHISCRMVGTGIVMGTTEPALITGVGYGGTMIDVHQQVNPAQTVGFSQAVVELEAGDIFGFELNTATSVSEVVWAFQMITETPF